jgi:hypothetical protein
LAEITQAGGNVLHSEIHVLINSIWNKEELPQQWKEYIILPIYKTDKTDCSGYREISLLPTTHKILSCILVLRLIPYVDEITGDYQCGFWCNRSTTDHILCICQILEKRWKYNRTVHQLFIDSEKAYDSVRETYCTILNEFGIHMKIVRLIKMCLNEIYSEVHMSDALPAQNGLK